MQKSTKCYKEAKGEEVTSVYGNQYFADAAGFELGIEGWI